jgi:hypothetical protein
MYKKIFLTLLIPLILTACASAADTTKTAASGTSSATELPAQTKLILGAIKLEETENAISAEQAAELLPMFYVLQDLNESDTAAQEEINGLTRQIEETLTAKQTQAIAAMSLTRQDMSTLIRGGNNNTNAAAAGNTSGGTGAPNGGFPGGGIPGGGIPGGTTTSGSNTETRTAMNTKTPSALFDAMINLLEKKIQP